jgi:DNA-binding IclR family transcriptional regulator
MVQSVRRSLDLLEALTERDEMGLVELAKRVGLQPSTAHRLLVTLVEGGYVFQSPDTGRYLLGFRVLELASHVERRTSGLRAAARPYLERIRKVSGETTNLVILHDEEIVYIDQLEGSHAMRMFMETGRSVPAHTAGAGKALMAHRPEGELEILRASEPYERLTANTIGTAEELRKELARIRRRGFAIDNEEHEEGVTCVAAPIFDFAGRAAAAISVSGPTPRLRTIGLRALGDLLVDQAAELSRDLGYARAS